MGSSDVVTADEALAHLLAHEVRTPTLLASQLLRATLAAVIEDRIGREALIERLRVTMEGLGESAGVCEQIVAALRDEPAGSPLGVDEPSSEDLRQLLADAFPGLQVAAEGELKPVGAEAAQIAADLAELVLDPDAVVVTATPMTIVVTGRRIGWGGAASVARWRLARTVDEPAGRGSLRVEESAHAAEVRVVLPAHVWRSRS